MYAIIGQKNASQRQIIKGGGQHRNVCTEIKVLERGDGARRFLLYGIAVIGIVRIPARLLFLCTM